MALGDESSTSTQIASSPGGSGDPAYSGSVNEQPSMSNKPPMAATSPSKCDKGTLGEILKAWFKADAQHSAVWRIEAKEDFDFRAGDQWTAEDRQLLNAQQRPHIVFNRVLTMLKAIAGMEINGRHEVQFIPVNTTQTALNELLSGASKWMAAGCDAEDEQSAAFENTCTCGMGWTESRLDFEENARGKYIEEMVDSIEMYWDRTAKKKNVADARRIARVRKMPLGDAMQIFTGFTKEQLDAVWAIGNEMDEAKKTLEEKRKREENTTDTVYDDQYEVTIVHFQWWEREVYYLVADPQTNTKTELTEEQWNSFEKRMHVLQMSPIGVKLTRRVYHQAFMGSELLKSHKSAIQAGFTWKCITGEFNRTKGTWFGIARLCRDPQMWANKWLSQVLHILNTTAKGGIVAEKGAFEDQREAEETWSRPDAITWVEEKALSGDKPKIMPKPGSFNPQGHLELMQFAITAIRDVTGINLELLGQKDINQPGILEAMRKQAGMTVLATLFDSLRRYRKLVGRVRLEFIQNFFADGRLIRVVGPDGAQALPLLKDKCIGEYEVIVDDAPASPNQKEQNWQIIQPFLVAFKDLLMSKPELLGIILDYSPLPSKLVEAVKAALQAAQDPNKKPTPQEQIALRGAVANVLLTEAKAHQADATAQKQKTAAVWDMASARNLEADAATHDHALASDMATTVADVDHTRAQADSVRAQTEKTRAETHGVHADAARTHAETVHKHVQAGVDAMTPIPHEPPPLPSDAGGV